MYQKKKEIRAKNSAKVHHSPTLRTVQMVEDTLKNMNESLITIAGLKRILPKKVNHTTLIEILHYLEKNNKILTSVKGITYIYNPSKKLQKAIANGYEFTPERIAALKEFIKKYDK